MNKKLSQIIIYVDKEYSESELCAFCTKEKEKRPEIWFTYYFFSEKSPDEAEIRKHFWADIKEDVENVLVLSNMDSVCKLAGEMNIPYAGLANDKSCDNDFGGALYILEELEKVEYELLDKIWRRYINEPWFIAETDRLVIREHTMDDVRELYEIYDDEDARSFLDPLKDDITKEAEIMEAYINSQYRYCEFGMWAVICKENKKLIGRAGIEIREETGENEIGFMITKEYRNKGYAKEAVKAVLDYAYDELEMKNIHAYIKKDNSKSRFLLDSLGFVYDRELSISGEICEDYYILLSK